uniref:Uncharacterized protein n=1 Tax=Tanacetum cinerariifolium TaxID=118510 RepID=A0A6L2LD23_TANCI|nr:hypothetical protein [Tanacetum cinerariifolium]
MMVQALADIGDTPVETHQTPIVDHLSTSKTQKKQKPRRKQRKEAKISHDESHDEDHVPTPSSDPLPSEIALDEETQGRTNNDEMFGVDDLAGEVVMDTTSGEHEKHIIEDVSTVKPITTAGEVVTNTTIKDSAAPTTTMRIDEKYTRKLEAEEQEATRLSRAQQDEKSNNSWDNIQAMMDADRLLAKKIQEIKREEFFEVDENVEPVIDDSKELKKCTKIVPDDGDGVLIEATPLSSRSSTIIDYKIHKEGKKTYFMIIGADGNSQVYQTFEKIFKNFNREDLKVLWAIVKDIFKKEKPMDGMDNFLFRTLKTMFKHHVEDTIWKYQQRLAKMKNFSTGSVNVTTASYYY